MANIDLTQYGITGTTEVVYNPSYEMLFRGPCPDRRCGTRRRYQQPYYQQPYQQPVIATKDHVAAGLLAIFLGALGIHKFYLGYNTAGFIMLAVTILGSLFTFGLAGGVMWVIGVIEGILYLTKSQSEFEQTYVVNKREWF